MKKVAALLTVLLLIFGTSVIAIAEEETKVPFSAVKSSCYGQIDMSKSKFLLSEVGKECVDEEWLEENLSETEGTEGDTDTEEGDVNKEEKESSELEELKVNIERILHDEMGKTVNWGDNQKTFKGMDLIKQFGYKEDVYLAKISYRINDNFTKGMIRGGMIGDAMDFFRKFFKNPQVTSVVECMLMPEFKMVDQYGNESEDQVAKIVVSRDLAEKIDWKNMYRDRFLDLVKDEGGLWLHPAIRE